MLQSWIHRLYLVRRRISISSTLFYSKALASCHSNLFDSTTWVSDHSVQWFGLFRCVYRIYSDSLSLWFGNRFPTGESLLLGYDAASRGNRILPFRSNISPSSSKVEAEDVSTLEDRTICCPETSEHCYPFTWRCIPEERNPQLHRWENLSLIFQWLIHV
jgi:hypothetical protein